MNEKHMSLDSVCKQQQTSRPRHWIIIALVSFCVFLLFSSRSTILPTLNHSRSLKYPGENIQWSPCGDLKGNPLECSSINVPMDQFNPENSPCKTFTIPLIRMRGSNATKNILLNPGGPGGGGFDLLYRRGDLLKTIIGDGFHLLSFDPRGVNSSTPMASCYPNKNTRQELSRVRSLNPQLDNSEIYAWAQNFVKACSDTMGEHATYLNTPQTASDMNSILDALGQKDMIYWGFSYGSLLGQTYAAMYPERSKRIIIDGVVNQFEWYEGLFEAQAFADTDKVLDGFFDECIKTGPRNCPLASLAPSSKTDLRDTVLLFTQTLQDQPIPVYINNSAFGLLDYSKVWYTGVLESLYKPALWPSLASNLLALLQDNATPAFLAYGITDLRTAWGHEANEFITLNDGLAGPTHWPQDRQSLVDKITPLLNNSLFGPAHNRLYYIRQQWRIPMTHTYRPRRNVQTRHPLLILSTTYDPVTPLRAARDANHAFDGSRIVEVNGYGHCSVAVPSLCIVRYVRGYLYEGRLPENYAYCDVDSPYFPQGVDVDWVFGQRVVGDSDSDEKRVHMAQLELAREWEWEFTGPRV
ncbi:Alpha/Beta hydrolase protein [Aspergillus cavernicola]|uniref:Alpha/Beta hydrolase protein n=1 Tax=Aspergillus cavernicola TaxID=176166 RepID=A0ABR4ILY7_9EURO